jgi:uncharacterized protein involved in exopolysaccharide biosynthesis
MSLQRGQSMQPPQFGSGDGSPGAQYPAGSPLGTGNRDQPLFRLNLLRALQLHRRLALGIALAGLVLAAAYVLRAWPEYTAQSQIYVQPVQSKVMAGANEQGWPNNPTTYDSYIQQQVQSASNPEVLINALHKLNSGSWERSGESEQAAADRLGKAIEVDRAGTSYEVVISAKAKDPQLVAQIANAVATSIVERASGEGNAGNAQRIAVLKEERTRIQDELNADYAEQVALNKQLGMAAVGTEAPDLIDSDIGKTREELIKAQTDHDQAEAHFTAMGAGNGDSSTAIDAEADDLVAADAGLTSMKTSLNSRRAILITQMSNLTPSNPEYKQDAAELAKINGNLDSMMKELRAKAAARIQEKLRTDLERTAEVEAKLNAQLRQLAGAAASATPKLQRASDLATDISRLRTRYTSVDEQLHNLMLEDSAPGAVHLSVAAVAPLHPTVLIILKRALPLALGGLLLGLLAASIANHLDPKVYIAADIEQVLGFAPMAVLPDFDEVSEEVSSEHLLRLSAAIEHARKQGDLNSCIFTGVAAGTGASTLATRVREILEAIGKPTVLLDSSGTPASRANSLSKAPGESVSERATERGSRSTALLRQVAEETEVELENLVLTDTAPLLISAETEYLARFVGCAIVVAESGVTTRAQLLAAAHTLQRLNVAAVGFVLNRVKLAKADPAFRHTVREIEKHHGTQSTSTPKRTERTSPVADELLPDPKELPSESGFVAHSAPAASELAAGSATHRSSLVAPKWCMAAPVKPWLPQTASTADADNPWWHSDVQSKPTAAPAEPEPPHESLRAAHSMTDVQAQWFQASNWKRASVWSDDSPPLEAAKTAPAAAAQADQIFAEEDFPAIAEEGAPMPITKAAPPIALKAAPAFFEDGDPGSVPQVECEEKPHVFESRLSPLRGLMFSRGLKNLGKIRGSVPQEDQSPLNREDETERTVLAPSYPSFVEAVPMEEAQTIPVAVAEPVPFVADEPVPVEVAPGEAEVASAPAQEVVATPEFLPPRDFVPVREREDDEPRILPSRRGQYKRRG